MIQSGRADYRETLIPYEQDSPRLEPWLDAQAEFKRASHLSHPSPVVGGLRLLVQKWTDEHGILDSAVPTMPFTRNDLEKIMNKLCLPPSFPLDFARCQQIPVEVKSIPTQYGNGLGWLLIMLSIWRVLIPLLQPSLVKVPD